MVRVLGVKWLVSGSVGVMLIIRQDGYWFSLVFGALANAVGVKILKRLFKRPRPKDCSKVDPGMPSSHAHMLGYFSTFALLTDAPKWLVLLGYLFAIGVSAERVHRGIHTLEQCAVGIVTGSAGAYLWQASPLHELVVQLDDYLTQGWETKALILLCTFVGAGVLSAVGRYISGKIESSE